MAEPSARTQDTPSQSVDREQEDLPCGAIDGVGDAAVLRRILQPGDRSAVFESSARILAEYGPHSICFFYVHVGEEIARVEGRYRKKKRQINSMDFDDLLLNLGIGIHDPLPQCRTGLLTTNLSNKTYCSQSNFRIIFV